MIETELRSEICKNINDAHVDCHACPIETDVSPGFYDIDVVLKGIQMGIELKTVDGPGGSYKVMPTQVAFTKRRANALGICLWVMVVQTKPWEVFITLGCPHDAGGRYRWNDENRAKWEKAKTGCVVLKDRPADWARTLYASAQSLAP